jgi:hypothetical protein
VSTAHVRIIPLPALEVFDAEICLGESIELAAVSDATAFEWSTGETTQSIIVTPVVSTIYTVTVGSGDCTVTKHLTVTVRDCVTNPGVGTIGFWKNHPESWPANEIVIGGLVYSKAAAIKLMQKPVMGDKTYSLFAQLAGAKLNVLIGNDPGCIASVMAAADAWMAAHPVGSNVGASSAAWLQAGPLHAALDNYNNGLMCAPARQ